MSQVVLAERLGVPQSFVSKYERGERRLDPVELSSICLAIGIPFAEFAKMFDNAVVEAQKEDGAISS